MKKLTFAEVRRLEADLKRLEFLKSQYAMQGPIDWFLDCQEKINQIKTLLSLHYGKD